MNEQTCCGCRYWGSIENDSGERICLIKDGWTWGLDSCDKFEEGG